jgi:outer membrane protein OmpA-like peptidoglycan-associated protein
MVARNFDWNKFRRLSLAAIVAFAACILPNVLLGTVFGFLPNFGSRLTPSLNSFLESPAYGAASDASQLEDYTNKLKLTPGMTILFPVTDCVDQTDHPLADHKMIIVIDKPRKDEAFSFKWTMTEPLNAAGERGVATEDAKSSHRVSFFYKNNEAMVEMGYTNAVRLSDAIYQDLKSGNPTEFETDGPYAPPMKRIETVRLPHTLQRIGDEALPMTVDEKQVSVRTIRAQADNGWKYWILDNPNMPMILKGEGPFAWDVPLVSLDGTMPRPAKKGGKSKLPAGNNEGKRIVRDLQKNGIATTSAINFDINSAKLRPSAKPILNEIAKYLKDNPQAKIEVQGHTCTIGAYQYNMDLSKRRAKAVDDYIAGLKIDASRMTPVGFGYTKPIADNKTSAGRAKNRRVVFKVLTK